MPFTFAHPAIVLPLAKLPKKTTSLTAVVVGSIVPDFEYFMRMRVYSIHSHTLGGLVYFDLPLGWLLFAIYVYVVKTPLIDHLPKYFRCRFAAFRSKNKRISKSHMFIIGVSILIGAFSHLLWDAFTHPHGYFVEHLPVLASQTTIAGHSLYLYKILQHLSTLAGFVVIGFVIHQLPVKTQPQQKGIPQFWAIAGGIAFLTVFLRLALASFNVGYGNIIVSAIAGIILGIAVASCYFGFRKTQNGVK